MKSILGELHIVVEQRFGSIDLGDRVSRDTSKLIGFGTYGNVYEGTLHPEQTNVAVKVIRYGDKSDLLELKVSSLFILVSHVSREVSESAERSVCLVQARSRQRNQTTWDHNFLR